MTSREHFEFLVAQGIIDSSGRVLVAKLFGDSSDGEAAPRAAPAPPAPPKAGQ